MLGDRIRTIRETLSITQEEFATKIGISRGALSRLESGQNNPSERTLKLICREFDVSSRYLLKGQEPMFAPKAATAIDRIDQLLGGGNEFVKAVFVELADLSDDEWQMLHDFVQRVMDRTKNPGQ